VDGLVTPAPWPALAEVLDRVLAARPRLGRVRLVAVDGPAGSGKSTFAAALAAALSERVTAPDGVLVLHLDDLYEGWKGLDGVWESLATGVLEPLAEGRPGRYRRYDWDAETWAEWVEVPVPRVLVVEGCGSGTRAATELAVATVWVEAPADVRLARGLARDGVSLRVRWLDWMVSEAAHFALERTRERADFRMDT
jgi:uridine kinase